MNVVVDTNVFVSAAIRPESGPRRVVEAVWLGGRHLLSDATRDELDAVLRRTRLNKYVTLSVRAEFFARVMSTAMTVEIVERVTACRDPKDDKFLEVAVNGNATHLVTGDQDLLALHPFRGIPILTPADFLALVYPPTS